MQKLKRLLFIILGVFLLFVFGSSLFFLIRPKVAGVYVDASPSALVMLDGKEAGSTPFEITQDPGEVVIKLIPKDVNQSNLLPYETRVSLQPGVQTVVRHTFGNLPDTGSGEIISFEALSKNDTALSIVTIPDGAEIAIDDTTKVFAPHKSSTITPGDHILKITSKGYAERTVKVKTHMGYKLTAVITLAKIPNAIVTITPSPTPTPIQTGSTVLILQTPTKTLRVRKEANTTSEEIGSVTSGESYPFLERDERTGWFKIAFDGKEGWVSSQYANKVDIKPSGSATPTPTKATILTPTPQVQPTVGG